MIYSKEYIQSLENFLNIVESDDELVKLLKEDKGPPLSEEENKALEEWMESGDPKVFEFLIKFSKSDFIRKQARHY